MSARATLVLKDQAGTPVSHNYTPDGDTTNGVHVFSEKNGVPAGFPTYTASLRTQANGKIRAQLKLAVPVTQTQTINGVSAPVVVRTAFVEVFTTFDGLSTDQERKDAIALMRESLLPGTTQIYNLLTVPEDIW